MENLCKEVILGHELMNQLESVTFKFDGSHPPIELCGVASASVASPSLFGNLTTDCHLIVNKSRRFNNADKRFIQYEVEKLLKDHVIEPSSSPWRSQVLVTPEGRHKRRMVVD